MVSVLYIKELYDVPLRIQLLATAGQMWNSSSPLQNIWNKKKVTLHPINHFQSRLKLIMDLSIKINVVINLQVKSSFSNSKYCMFKANSYYCSVYCFIDNFNTYWLVKNIWHAWNIYMQCHILLTCSSGKREKWPTFDKNPSYQPDIWKKKTKAAKHII